MDSLEVVGSSPRAGGTLPADRPIRIFFDGYLTPGTDWSRLARLTSADLEVSARVTYDPVARALVVVPQLDLRPGLAYTVTVAGEGLRSVDGREVEEEEFQVGFVAGPPSPGRPSRREVDFATEIAPVFAERCGCHGPEPDVYPPLTPEALIDQPSQRQPERTLVVPGDALRSYLVQRLLDEYPGVHGLPMPPDAPLREAELRRVVSWVEGL